MQVRRGRRGRHNPRVSRLWSVLRGSLLLPGDGGSQTGHEAGLASPGGPQAGQTLTTPHIATHLGVIAIKGK